MQYVFWYDWLISFLIIMTILIWSKSFISKNHNDILINKYFSKAIALKVVGSLAFSIYHIYMYGGGDTFGYFLTGQSITKTFFTAPADFFSLAFLPLSDISNLVDRVEWLYPDNIMWTAESNYFSARIAAIIELFTFQAYLPTALIYSLISFWGIWKCFKFFNKLFPGQDKIIAISFLYFPTVVFWGSGLGKDSVSLGAICGLTVCAYQIFIYKTKLIKNAIGMALCLFVLFIIKAYIALAFMMPLALSITFIYIGGVKNILGKIVVVPLLIGILLGSAILLNGYIQNNFLQFSVESINSRIIVANTVLQEAGSAYDLGIKPEDINGLGDMLPFFPKAVVATWYRPWLWEAKNPAMLLSALESVFLLFLTLIILIRGYFLKIFYIFLRNPVLFSLFVYAFIFSGLIGLSTGNFGTLVRYKIPMLPFLVMVLLLTNSILKSKSDTKITINREDEIKTI